MRTTNSWQFYHPYDTQNEIGFRVVDNCDYSLLLLFEQYLKGQIEKTFITISKHANPIVFL